MPKKAISTELGVPLHVPVGRQTDVPFGKVVVPEMNQSRFRSRGPLMLLAPRNKIGVDTCSALGVPTLLKVRLKLLGELERLFYLYVGFGNIGLLLACASLFWIHRLTQYVSIDLLS